jgi:K+-transporting ATPase A subunit
MDWWFVGIFFAILVLLFKPLGRYIQKVLDPYAEMKLDWILKPIERFIYRACGIDPRKEHSWKEYLFALLAFSFSSLVGHSRLCFAIQGGCQQFEFLGTALLHNSRPIFKK